MSRVIHLDAVRYSPETVERLYVPHPVDLPNPGENCLVVGPKGSGKTMLLKALYRKWQRHPDLVPLDIDLDFWIGKIAGDVPDTERDVTPRILALRNCVALALGVAILERARESMGFDVISSVVQSLGLDGDPRQFVASAQQRIRRALVNASAEQPAAPSVPSIADSLALAVRREAGRSLVLLVDQTDQVKAHVVEPVVQLLRRHTHCTAIVATRPCPTAPHSVQVPHGVVAGESYRVVAIDRRQASEWAPFLSELIGRLPLRESLRRDAQRQAGILSALAWPSWRDAIKIVLAADSQDGVPESVSWSLATETVSLGYEALVKDRLRGWCGDPSRLIRQWRDQSRHRQDSEDDSPARARIAINDLSLIDSENDVTRFLRIGIKYGILSCTPDSPYLLDQIPDQLEIAPLLLWDPEAPPEWSPDVRSVKWDVTPRDAKAFVKRRGGAQKPRRKEIFVSHWMSDRTGRSQDLAARLQDHFGDTVAVEIGRSDTRAIAPDILKKIVRANLVVCDLSTPRPDIFVEYGWAIGTMTPLLQVSLRPPSDRAVPSWVLARELLPYEEPGELADLASTVVKILNRRLKGDDKWRASSLGEDLRGIPHAENVALFGRRDECDEIARLVQHQSEKRSFHFVHVDTGSSDMHLEKLIIEARRAGTIIAAFQGAKEDFTVATAVGIALARPSLKVNQRSRRKTAFLIDVGDSHARRNIPKLLREHPRGKVIPSVDDVPGRVATQLDTFARLMGFDQGWGED